MTPSWYSSLDLVLHACGVLLCALWLLFRSFALTPRSDLVKVGLQRTLVATWVIITVALTYAMGVEALWITPSLALCLCLSLMHPSLAAAQLVMLCILRPWEAGLPGDFLQKIPTLILSSALISLVLHKVHTRDEAILVGRNGIIFFLLMVWLGINSELNPGSDSYKIFSEQVVPLAIIAFLVLQSLKDPPSITTVGGGMALSILYLVASTLLRSDPSERLTGIGMWANSNDLAALAVTGIGVFIGLCVSAHTSTFIKIIAGLCSCLLLIGAIQTQSRGALLAIVVVGFFVLLYVPWRVRIGLGVLLAIIAAIFIQAVQSRSSTDLVNSRLARANYAVVGLKMVASAPVLGVGIGNYPLLFDRYTEVFLEEGHRTAHSSVILLMAEAGLPALLLIGILGLSTAFYAFRLIDSYPELLLGSVAYAVMFLLLSHAYIFFPYVIFFLVQAAALQRREEQNAFNLRFAYDTP